MVCATIDEDKTRHFLLRPNQSLTWRESQVFFLITAAVSLTIALAFTAAGFWPVLPFAGLELAALGAALYVTAQRGARNEWIAVSGHTVEVCKGRRAPEQRWEFHRGWARVALVPSSRAWYPSRLVIRSHGREVELGGFLNEDERQDLARALASALAP